uniref:Protein with SprT-like domain at the N terminus n=1 Tax=Anopheles arabiensis TaxID=7173 RepID=A0A182I819_ANOAR
MGKDVNLDCTQNLVHPDWEILDPTPDIFALFPLFDRKFFQGRLSCVQLEWSKKMYNCAGICYQRSNRLGKSCIIRLSEPLLKLRPRKDLIQTLLHEMIHAYCFVLGIREGNGGHGPTFKKIMNGINKIAGTNITVYHSFHDEVDLYKTHWWKCNGPCQHRHPFYGLVKRTTNRKPGTYDFWWQEHQNTCGGEFIKIREPSPKRKRAVTNKENIMGSQTPSQPRRSQDSKPRATPNNQKNVISNYFNNSTTVSIPTKKPTYTTGAKPNFGGGTLVIRKPPTTQTRPVVPKKEKPPSPILKEPPPVQKLPAEGNLRNVRQFKDLSSDEEGPPKAKKPPVPIFSGTGFVLGTASTESTGARRSRLLDKFSSTSGSAKPSSTKKPRTERTDPKPSSSNAVESILLSDDSDGVFEEIDLTEVGRTVENIKKERQDAIKKEIVDSLTNDDMDEIYLIDDDYDDELADEELSSIDDTLLDRSVIDELFNDSDELIEDFNRTNAQIKIEKPDDEIVSCPMCLKKVTRGKIGDHLEDCYAHISGEPRTVTKKKPPATREQSPCATLSGTSRDGSRPSTSRATSNDESRPSTSGATPARRASAASKKADDMVTAHQQLLRDCGYGEADITAVLQDISMEEMPAPTMTSLRQQVLRDCGYSEEDILRVLDDASPEELQDNDVEFISAVESCDCPICGKKVALNLINQHLDQCLMK